MIEEMRNFANEASEEAMNAKERFEAILSQ